MDHEIIEAKELSARNTYRLMTDLVAPRPIAWVSTLDADGQGNLAPFSYFQAVCSAPATIVLGLGWRADGSPKDTLRNVLDTREFTVSHVSEALAEPMNQTSGDYAPTDSEWAHAQPGNGGPLQAAPARLVKPPFVARAQAAYECRMVHAVPLGQTRHGTPSTTLVVAEVVCFHVARGLLTKDEAGHYAPIDPAQLASVGRLGGIAYTKTSQTFELSRPKVS